MHLLDKVLQHLLGHIEVGDNPIFHWADGLNIAGGTSQHLLRLSTDCGHGFLPRAASFSTDGDHGRLIQYNAFFTNINESVSCTQIDRQIVRKNATQLLEHVTSLYSVESEEMKIS